MKLSPQREEQIRELLQEAQTESPASPLTQALAAVVGELDRIRPDWPRVADGEYIYDRYYHVAGTTPSSPTPVWLGRGKFDSDWQKWLDANTGKPFPIGTEITHWFRSLSPTEMIGQPKAE